MNEVEIEAALPQGWACFEYEGEKHALTNERQLGHPPVFRTTACGLGWAGEVLTLGREDRVCKACAPHAKVLLDAAEQTWTEEDRLATEAVATTVAEEEILFEEEPIEHVEASEAEATPASFEEVPPVEEPLEEEEEPIEE